MEKVSYDSNGISETNANGSVVFSANWKDIQRATLRIRRDCYNDIEDVFYVIEVTRQQTGMMPYTVHSEHDPVMFEQWVDALAYWLPEFSYESIDFALEESRSLHPTTNGLDVEHRLDLFVTDWIKHSDGSYIWADPETVVQESDLSGLDEPHYEWFDKTHEGILGGRAEGYSENASRAFRSLYLLHTEVLNGGVEQYLGNSTGNEALFAIDALRTIKASASASALSKVIERIWPMGYPENVETRQHRLGNCTTEDLNVVTESDFQIATGWIKLLRDWMDFEASAQ